MKSYRFFAMAFFIVASLITVIIGCKYDVSEPLWYGAPPNSLEVTITGVNPAQATGGVYYITILGTNLSGALDSISVKRYYYYTDSLNVKDSVLIVNNNFVHNGVYFNSVQATIVKASSTSITVLRPDVVSDTCIIMIASNQALGVTKYPYRITAIKQSYGDFTTNVPLNTVTLDNAGNLYVIDAVTTVVSSTVSNYLYDLWKITPGGGKTLLGYLGGETPTTQLAKPLSVSDAKISPDGKLYYLQSVFPNNKDIHMIDLNAATLYDSVLFKSSPYKVSFGDFDNNGYFYMGGIKSGIVVIRPDNTLRSDGYYAQDTILGVRVFNSYLYVATRNAFWRHSLGDTSKIGAQELVLDCTQTPLASYPISGFSFSADGSKMFIGTNSTNPLLFADATTTPISPSSVDFVYKGILPTYCKQICFGDNIYYISGNATPSVNWLVYKIDVGTTGAPYY